MGERGCDQAADVHLADALGAGPGEQGMGLEEAEGVGDRRLMAAFDRRGRVRIRKRPQSQHALDRGERQVEARDRRRLRAGRPRDKAGQLPGVPGFAAELAAEELPTHLGSDPCPLTRGDRRPAGRALEEVERGEPSGDLEAERGHVGGEDLERRAEPGRLPIVGLGEPRPVQRIHTLLREGVHSGAEQVLHLLGGHLVAGVQTVDAGHPRPQPHAGALAALGAVGRQTEVALLGGVLHRDLPGQVVIPRSGGDLVQAHHTNQK